MGITLLLVDDHPLFRTGLQLLLEKQRDLRVVGEAGDGQTAIELVRERSPDVVVMDITMPELDGIEATRRILAESPGTKVVALSIHAEKRFVEDMLRAGAAGYILKESVPEELVNGIRTVAGGEVYLSAAIKEVVVSHYMSLLTGDQTPGDDEEPEELPPTTWDRATIPGVITTKLHRPPLIPDLVLRPRLLEQLNRYRRQPLTLISAGAGYGKSTLVSHWLETADWPGAWLSLDERDDDLVSFLTHFIAAIRTIFPEAGQETLRLVLAPTLPPLPVLAASLAKELDQIETPFILVLDDYHHIREFAIHNLLNELLRHPPQPMHLVIVTRRDPLLDLTNLRARGQVTEIGDPELRFTVAETADFLQRVTQSPVDEAAAAALEQKIEGWVTGLRLSALTLRHRGDLDRLLRSLPENIHYVTDYLMAEVVSHQPPAVQDFLLKTAILERFCAPLADAILGRGAEEQRSRGAEEQGRWGAEEQRSRGAEEQGRKGEAGITSAPQPPRSPAPPLPRPLAPSPPCPPTSGETILEQLQHDNLFIIPLDDQRVWFRYHHLFRDLLQQRLNQTQVPESIAALHRRASEWFAANNLIEEAIQHALAAGDAVGAAQIVERQRQAILNEDKWHVLAKWLSKLPDNIKQQRPELLVAQAWVYIYQLNLMAVLPMLEKVEQVLSSDQANHPLWGEVNYFKGYIWYFQGQGSRSEEYNRRALELIPEAHYHNRGEAELIYALALHMVDHKEKAIGELNDRLQTNRQIPGIRSTRLWAGLYFIHLLEGNLPEVLYPARQCQAIGSKYNIVYAESWGIYMQTCVHFLQNDHEEARQKLGWLAKNRYLMHTRAAIDCLCGLALIYQMKSQTEKVEEVVRQLLEFARDMNDPAYILIASSCQARLSLLQGDKAAAVRWLQTTDLTPDAGIMLWWLETPRLTACRVLIAQGSEAGLHEAIAKLQEYERENEAVHNNLQVTQILLLQAVAYRKQAKAEETLTVLKRAVEMAQSGGIIRPFVELGDLMADLLMQLHHQDVAPDYIDQILAAFGTKDERRRPAPPLASTVHHPSSSLIEPLTPRELEVLELLAQRLSDKEIGQELVISTMTVKKHNTKIFQKLGVKSRWEATLKAITLGILSDG